MPFGFGFGAMPQRFAPPPVSAPKPMAPAPKPAAPPPAPKPAAPPPAPKPAPTMGMGATAPAPAPKPAAAPPSSLGSMMAGAVARPAPKMQPQAPMRAGLSRFGGRFGGLF